MSHVCPVCIWGKEGECQHHKFEGGELEDASHHGFEEEPKEVVEGTLQNPDKLPDGVNAIDKEMVDSSLQGAGEDMNKPKPLKNAMIFMGGSLAETGQKLFYNRDHFNVHMAENDPERPNHHSAVGGRVDRSHLDLYDRNMINTEKIKSMLGQQQ